MKDREDKFTEDAHAEAHPALKSLRNLPVEPSPYLAARTLAQGNDQISDHFFLKKNNWKNIFSFLAGTAVSAVVVTFLFWHHSSATLPSKPSQFTVLPVGSAYLVKMDLRNLQHKDVVSAEVEVIGDSIQFYSQSHMDLSEQSKLVFEWEQINNRDYLPIVVRGIKSGHGKMVFSFYNQRQEKIDESIIPINIEGPL